MQVSKLTCHCGSVEIELQLPNGLENLRRCNCTICSKKNALVADVEIGSLKILKGEEILSAYTFNTHKARHYFCSKCGIYTHHRRRSSPSKFGFKFSCIEGISVEDYLHVGYVDGRNNHPADYK